MRGYLRLFTYGRIACAISVLLALATVALAVPAIAAAGAPSTGKRDARALGKTERDARALGVINAHFGFVWEDRYAVTTPMGSRIGSLEVDRQYLRVWDPATQSTRGAYSAGLFGFVDSDGSVGQIDTSLQRTGVGYVPAGVGYSLKFGDSFADGTKWGNRLGSRSVVRITPLDVKRDSRGKVVGKGREKLLYSDVWGSTDVLVGARGEGMKDYIVIRNAKGAPSSFRFRINRARDARTVLRGDRSIAVVQGDGDEIALMPRPVGYDATGRSVPVWYTVKRGKIFDVLTLHYDAGLRLSDDGWIKPVYPLLLDPIIYSDAIGIDIDTFSEHVPADHLGIRTEGFPNVTNPITLQSRFDTGYNYQLGSIALWTIGGPPSGATWLQLAADVEGMVNSRTRYTLHHDGAVDPIFGYGPATTNGGLFTGAVNFVPVGRVSSRLRQQSDTSAATTDTYSGTLKNISRTFNDNQKPSINNPAPIDEAKVPSTFTASFTGADGQSGCLDSSITLFDSTGTIALQMVNAVGCPPEGLSATFGPHAPGAYSVRYMVRDNVKYVTEESHAVYIPAGPNVELSSPNSGLLLDTPLTVSGVAAGTFLARIDVTVDGQLASQVLTDDQEFSYQIDTSGFSEGEHTVCAVAVNVLNGSGSACALVALDHTAPEVDLIEPLDGARVNGELPVTATAADAVGLASFEFLLDGESQCQPSTPADDPCVFPYEATFSTSELADGSHTITARAVDHVGHITNVTHTIIVDNTAPTGSILTPADGAVISGTATVRIDLESVPDLASAEVDLIDPSGRSVRLLAIQTVGVHSVDLDTDQLRNGTYALRLTMTDTIGNSNVEEHAVTVANTVTVLGQEQWLSESQLAQGVVVSHGSGNLTTTSSDVDTSGLGIAMLVSRTYNHQDAAATGFGLGWRASFDRSVSVNMFGDATYIDADGTRHLFIAAGDGGFERAVGLQADLVATAGGFELTGLDASKQVFDSSGRLAFDQTANGSRLTVDREPSGRATGLHDDSGLEISIAYNAEGLIESITDQLARSSTYTYSGTLLASSADAAGGVTHYRYDAQGRIVELSDPLGRAVSAAYDSSNRVVRITDGENTKSDFVYGPGSVQISVDDPRVTTYGIDPLGRAIQTVDPAQETSSQTFTASGLVASQTNESGQTASYTYNARGDMTSASDFAGHTTTYSDFNNSGGPASVTDPKGNTTTYLYDASGNAASITSPRGATSNFTYDSAGSQTSSTDALGNTTHSEHDAHGNLISRTQPGGIESTYVVDAAGQVLIEADPNGNETRFAYDPAGRVTETQDAESGVTTTTFNAAGDVVREVDARGNATAFAYDNAGRQVSQTSPLGARTTYGYNPFGEQVSVTDPNGNATHFEFNAQGVVESQTDPLGRTTTYFNDAQGRVVATTDPAGFTSHQVYDANGNMTLTTQANGSTISTGYDPDGSIATTTDASGHTTSMAYDLDGNQSSSTDALGQTTSSVFDLNGGRTASRDASGAVTSFVLDALGRTIGNSFADGSASGATFDDAGNELTRTDPIGNTTRMAYDRLNRLTTETDSLGNITRYAYDASGNLVQTIDKSGGVSTFEHDAENRLVQQADPNGNLTSYDYDAAGNMTSMTDPAGKITTFEFDAANQVTGETDPNHNTATASYDLRGLLESQTNALGQTTSYSYDQVGQLDAVTDPEGETTAYEYDPAGNLTSRTDQSGLTTSYTFDAANRLTGEANAIEGATNYSYSPRGDLLAMTTAAGTTSYSHDVLGRVTGVTFPDASGESFSFDAAGNLQSRTDSTGTTTFAYDSNNRLTGETPPGGVTIEYSYDADGRIASISADGAQTSYQYDQTGFQASQATAAGTVNYGYTARHELATVTTPGAQSTGYLYDAATRLTRISDTAFGQHDYIYDEANRITAIHKPSGSDSYTYNERGELTSWTRHGTTTTYAFDVVGNLSSEARTITGADSGPYPPGIIEHVQTCLDTRLADCPNQEIKQTIECLTAPDPCNPASLTGVRAHTARIMELNHPGTVVRTFQHNANNQLTSSTDSITGETQTFDYDGRGNQTSQGVNPFTFDSRNHLMRADTAQGAVEYLYDSRGLKTSRTASGETDRYAYDQYGRLTKETAATGASVNYAHDQQGLRSITTDAGTFYFHYNHRGDTLALTDTNGQTVVAYAYTPWGEQVATGDAALIAANRFTYNGQDGVEYDSQTGLYWMHARWYDPAQHRFISSDPMPSLAGTADNPYSLTANDPVNLIDPAGTSIIFTRRTPASTTQPAPSILPTGYAWSATPVYVPLTIAPLPRPEPPIPPAPTPGYVGESSDSLTRASSGGSAAGPEQRSWCADVGAVACHQAFAARDKSSAYCEGEDRPFHLYGDGSRGNACLHMYWMAKVGRIFEPRRDYTEKESYKITVALGVAHEADGRVRCNTGWTQMVGNDEAHKSRRRLEFCEAMENSDLTNNAIGAGIGSDAKYRREMCGGNFQGSWIQRCVVKTISGHKARMVNIVRRDGKIHRWNEVVT